MSKVSEIPNEHLEIAMAVLQAYHDDLEALRIINKTNYAFMTTNTKDAVPALTPFTGAFPEQTKTNIYSLLRDLGARLELSEIDVTPDDEPAPTHA